MSTLVIESIPDALHDRLTRAAQAEERSVSQQTIHILESALGGSEPMPSSDHIPYWARRKLLPEFAKLVASGELVGGTDSTVSISEERDAR